MLASLIRSSSRALRVPPHNLAVLRTATRAAPLALRVFSTDRPEGENKWARPTDSVPHSGSAQELPTSLSPGQKPSEKSVLWLTSLPRKKTEHELKEDLASMTGITRIDIPTKGPGYNKGFAFVHFDTPENKNSAMQRLTSEPLFFGERRVIVQEAMAPAFGAKRHSIEFLVGHTVTDAHLRSLADSLTGLRQITTNRTYKGERILASTATLYFDTHKQTLEAEQFVKTITELQGKPIEVSTRNGKTYISGKREGEGEGESIPGAKPGHHPPKQVRESGSGPTREGREKKRNWAPRSEPQTSEVLGSEAAKSEAPKGEVPTSEAPVAEVPETDAPVVNVDVESVEVKVQPSESSPAPPATETPPTEAEAPTPEAPTPSESSPAPSESPKPV